MGDGDDGDDGDAQRKGERTVSLSLLATTKAEHKVEGALLLDVVISKGVTVLELLAGKDKTLLIRGDTLLVLDLSLHVVDAVSGLNLKSDSLARQGLHENLHVLHKQTKKTK